MNRFPKPRACHGHNVKDNCASVTRLDGFWNGAGWHINVAKPKWCRSLTVLLFCPFRVKFRKTKNEDMTPKNAKNLSSMLMKFPGESLSSVFGSILTRKRFFGIF